MAAKLVSRRIFDHAAVDYIHVRNGEAGCFIARLERVAPIGDLAGEVRG